MRAGEMRSRIRIERKAVDIDPEYGTTTEQWLPFAEVWAEIEDQLPTKAESTTHGLRIATSQVRIRIRYLAGVTAAMRIVELNGMQRTLQITAGPAMTQWRENLEIMAESYSS